MENSTLTIVFTFKPGDQRKLLAIFGLNKLEKILRLGGIKEALRRVELDSAQKLAQLDAPKSAPDAQDESKRSLLGSGDGEHTKHKNTERLEPTYKRKWICKPLGFSVGYYDVLNYWREIVTYCFEDNAEEDCRNRNAKESAK